MCLVHTSDFAHLEIHMNHTEWYTEIETFSDDKGIAVLQPLKVLLLSVI